MLVVLVTDMRYGKYHFQVFCPRPHGASDQPVGHLVKQEHQLQIFRSNNQVTQIVKLSEFGHTGL